MYRIIIHYKINGFLGFGVHQSEDPTDGIVLLRHVRRAVSPVTAQQLMGAAN